MCAAVGKSHGSLTTEDMDEENGPAAVKGSVRDMEGGGAAVERGSAAVEGDSVNMKDEFAAMVGGRAAGSIAEAEGVQHIPQLAATAYAPGSFGLAMSIWHQCLFLLFFGGRDIHYMNATITTSKKRDVHA